jgi:predicted phosphodiesterase
MGKKRYLCTQITERKMKKVISTKQLLTSIGCLLFSLFTQAQTRITVLTDTHVMGPGLLISDGTAWQNALANDRKLIDYGKDIFDQLVDQLINSDKPDLVLITGDMTKDGEMLSHQYVVGQLDRLRQAGIKTYVIPGNHDRGTGNALYFNGDATNKAATPKVQDFMNLYENYGYGSESSFAPSTLTYACEPIDGLVLNEGKQVLAMMHHALFPHFNGEDKFISTAVVKNYEVVRNRLADAGIRVVLTGHFHTSDIAKDFNGDLTKPIYDISTGSTVSYPCDYRQLTLSSDRRQLRVETKSMKELNGDKYFSTTAKNRLNESMTTLAQRALGNEMAAEMAAKAFIIHAEGNENKSSDAKSVISTFKMAKLILKNNATINKKLQEKGLTWDSAEAIIRSMMEDKSQYGINGRENQTDDRSVTIQMPEVKQPTGINSIKKTETPNEYYSLQGFRIQTPQKRGFFIRNRELVVTR